MTQVPVIIDEFAFLYTKRSFPVQNAGGMRYIRVVDKKTRVVGYIRVSTGQQADEGISLEVQTNKIQAYAIAMDLKLVGIVEDSTSAKSLDRPGLQKALAMLEAGAADGLLVAKLDRLTRRVSDLGLLIDRYFAKSSSLLSVSDSIDTRSASGRLVLNVLMSVAQWEREAIAERTKEALAQLKKNGVRLGRDGLGWKRSAQKGADGRRTVVDDPHELRALARIFELHSEGHSLREIVETLVTEKHDTKRGGLWYASTVRAALLRGARKTKRKA